MNWGPTGIDFHLLDSSSIELVPVEMNWFHLKPVRNFNWFQREFRPGEVLCAGSGSGSVANRAFSVRWEVFTGYVFPPTHPPNSTEGEAGSGYRPPHCPVVAEENVVPRNDNPSSGVSENPPRSQGRDIPADTGDPAPKAVRPPIPVLQDFSVGANLRGWIPVRHL